MRVQPLLFEAKALYFVEVEACFEGNDIIGGNSYDRLVCWVPCTIKGQCSLPGHNFDLHLLWLELPQQGRTGIGIEPVKIKKQVCEQETNNKH